MLSSPSIFNFCTQCWSSAPWASLGTTKVSAEAQGSDTDMGMRASQVNDLVQS